MRGVNHFRYAQARIQSRYGQRPTEALWRELGASQTFHAYLETARTTRIGPWVSNLSRASDVHDRIQSIEKVAGDLFKEWGREIEEIGVLARKHDLWIISDEVYEHLVFEGAHFVSPLGCPGIEDRVIGVSSISKSHAAPGFRSGWCVAPERFCDGLLPLSETMLFGNQPFIADMTEKAVRAGSPVAAGMRRRFAARATRIALRLERETDLRVHRPDAGMFALIDVSSTGLDGEAYAMDLLYNAGVAVMPGTSFGAGLASWVRVALTIPDDAIDQALNRITDHAQSLDRKRA